MVYHPRMRVRALPALVLALVAAALVRPSATPELGPVAARWVSSPLDGMTLDQKIGQLLMPSFRTTYFSNDSDRHDRLVSLVREQHVGGFLLFAGRLPAPNVLLGGGYPRGVPGQPLAAASTNNRLQAESALPLLNAADIETGVGVRIGGCAGVSRVDDIGHLAGVEVTVKAGADAGAADRAVRVVAGLGLELVGSVHLRTRGAEAIVLCTSRAYMRMREGEKKKSMMGKEDVPACTRAPPGRRCPRVGRWPCAAGSA